MKTLFILIPAILFAISTYCQKTASLLQKFTVKGHEIVCTAINNTGEILATGGMDNKIYLWKTTEQKPLLMLTGHKNFPISITFSPDGLYLVSGGKDEKVILWNVSTGAIVKEMNGHKGTVRWVAISPDNKLIASAGDDKSIKIWNLPSGELVKTLVGHTEEVQSVNFSPDGKKLVSASFDKTVREWYVSTGNLIRTINAHKKEVRVAKYSPDGRFIASCGDDKRINIWDEKSELYNSILVHKDVVQTITYSPDGKYIASGAHDKFLALINITTGAITFLSKKLNNYVLSVSFDPNGKFFISATLLSNELCLWEVTDMVSAKLDETKLEANLATGNTEDKNKAEYAEKLAQEQKKEEARKKAEAKLALEQKEKAEKEAKLAQEQKEMALKKEAKKIAEAKLALEKKELAEKEAKLAREQKEIAAREEAKKKAEAEAKRALEQKELAEKEEMKKKAKADAKLSLEQKKLADKEAKLAQEQKEIAAKEEAKKKAEEDEKLAIEKKEMAEKEAKLAQEQRELAAKEEAKKKAEEEEKLALEKKEMAEKEAKFAQEQKEIALKEEEKKKAEEEAKLAMEQRKFEKKDTLSKTKLGLEPEELDISKVERAVPNEYRYAVIIGNEDYSSFQAGLSSEVNVDYAENDAKAFKEYAIKIMGVPEENVDLRINARQIEMKRALKRIGDIIDAVHGKAEVYFYYAGHGFPDEQTKEPYLIPVDVAGSEMDMAIPLKEIYARLAQFPSKRITVFMDACFSGGARNQGLISARGIKIKPKEESLLQNSNIVVFTSSSAEQSSLAYKAKKHGMFTYFLLKKMAETKGEITYGDLSEYVGEQVGVKSVTINGKKQSPQTNFSPILDGKWNLWKIKGN